MVRSVGQWTSERISRPCIPYIKTRPNSNPDRKVYAKLHAPAMPPTVMAQSCPASKMRLMFLGEAGRQPIHEKKWLGVDVCVWGGLYVRESRGAIVHYHKTGGCSDVLTRSYINRKLKPQCDIPLRIHISINSRCVPEVGDDEDDGGADGADLGAGEQFLGDGDRDDLCLFDVRRMGGQGSDGSNESRNSTNGPL